MYSSYNYNLPSAYSDSISTSLGSTQDITSVLMAFLGGFLGIIAFVGIAILVLQIIGMWKIFTKAGEAGWKSLIPFYNIAIMFKISGMSPYLVFVYLGLFIPIINVFAAIAITIFDLYQKINICKAFKKTTGFTVAMIMVPFIANLILGLGSSQYYGIEETKA